MTQTASPDDVKLKDFLCFAVYQAGHGFNRVYKTLLDPLGLTYPQYLVMNALWERDDQTVGSLGEALALESNTLTPLLKRLEAQGRLSRARDPQDERSVRVRLTDEGRALADQARHVSGCILEATGMEIPDLVRLQQQIVQLRQALEAHAGKA